jgi:zona occludens toxin
MITLLTGLPGHGKGVYGIDYIKTKAEKEGRAVYYSGIPDLKLPWLELDNAEDWYKVPPNSIIFIDECQRVFRPRGNGSAVPKHVEMLETHRHLGLDLFLVTQHPMLVDGNVRRLVDKHFHIVRKYGMQKAVVHEFPQLVEQPHKSRAGSIRHDYTYNKSIYQLYKSAEVHTVKRSIPMRYLMMFVIPFLILGLVYVAYRILDPYKEHSKPAAGSSEPITMVKASGSEKITSKDAKPDYFDSRSERVAGLPQTAPIYDDLTKPKAVPYPAACVLIRDKCTCYSQQATKLLTDDATCRQIVANGYFIDFQDPKDLLPKPAPRPTQPSELLTDSPKGRTVAPAPVGVAQVPAPGQVRSPSESMSAAESLNYNTVSSGNGI